MCPLLFFLHMVLGHKSHLQAHLPMLQYRWYHSLSSQIQASMTATPPPPPSPWQPSSQKVIQMPQQKYILGRCLKKVEN